jgi:ParB/RepB/Spo0J family partition protein
MTNEPKIEQITLDRIKPSKTNPRKHFDETYIAELGQSIRQKGILQPLTVRPAWCIGKDDDEIEALNGNAPAPDFFEIVAGECRYRGAVKAEQKTVPTIVRHLSDSETLEIQVIENLQRSDLTPLEEAEGYRRLRDEYGYTVELIHERTGNSKRTIYGKLKMLNAPKVLLDALAKDAISEAHCEIVARIPDPKMRERAAREILEPKFLQENNVGALRAVPDQPMSLRVARAHLRDNYMRSLAGAEFDPKDTGLVAVETDEDTGERIAGGACDDCPMRSGNRPDLMGDLKRPDICTNPKCFAQKSEIYFVRLQETALVEGKKLLTAEESAEVFEDETRLWFDSPYVKLGDQPDRHEVAGDVKKIPSWKKLLEGVEHKPQIVIARNPKDPKGRIVELVDRKLAIEAIRLAAKQKGEPSVFDSSPKAGTRGSGRTVSSDASSRETEKEPAWKAQERKNREISKFNFAVTLAGLTELIDAIDKRGLIPGLLDAIIEASIEHAGHDGCWLICKRNGLDPKAVKKKSPVQNDVEEAVREYGRSLADENHKLGFVVELLLSKKLKVYNSGSMGGLRGADVFKPFAKLFDIKIDDIEKQVRSDSKEKKKTPVKSAKPETTPEVVSARVEKAGKSVLKSVAALPHKFKNVADNKYRCDCGAFAVKHEGKMIVAKEFRNKPCTRQRDAAFYVQQRQTMFSS